MSKTLYTAIVIFASTAQVAACNRAGPTITSPKIIDGVLLPDVATTTFVKGVDHPYFPLPVGATWVYQATTDKGLERTSIEVLAETRDIRGVGATVVRDTVTLDGETIEDTWDWYAQDTYGNVWYLGEDTCEYENGKCGSKQGAWEWGVNGALPGIVMPAEPAVDRQPYYQEYHVGEAEDAGEVVGLGETVTVPAGVFDGCLKTHETSTLDRQLSEHKFYCRGVGLARVEQPDTSEELIKFGGLAKTP